MTAIYSVESPDVYVHFETKKEAVDFAKKIFKRDQEEGLRENVWVQVTKNMVCKLPAKTIYIAMLDGRGWVEEQETILELRG